METCEDNLPLTVDSLCYSINGAPLVNKLDLFVASPGVTVILGPNGAGKSLLLRLLNGLLKPDSGTIRWGGQKLSDESRNHHALVFQKPILLRRSARGNIEFVLKLRKFTNFGQRCDELLDKVNLESHGQQNARTLSGGEQQRLALARSLALDPVVMMMDEPTANLDPMSTGIIENIVKQKSRGGTKILFITHDLGQARRLADDVVFMHHGRITENTPAGVFFDRPESRIAESFLSGQLVI